MNIPLRKRYREPSSAKKTPMRSRTGPICCHETCPSKPKGINRRKSTWGHKIT